MPRTTRRGLTGSAGFGAGRAGLIATTLTPFARSLATSARTNSTSSHTTTAVSLQPAGSPEGGGSGHRLPQAGGERGAPCVFAFNDEGMRVVYRGALHNRPSSTSLPESGAYARSNYGVALTEAEASRHRETFFRTYPGLRAWHRSMPDAPIETRTLAGRRRVGVAAFTEKLNTPVQGTGADGLKRALALLWERRSACLDAFPVLLVHDEVVVECDESRQEEAAAWLRDAMRDGMAPLIDPVPVEVEVSAGRTWGG